jgi:hypothetical protein
MKSFVHHQQIEIARCKNKTARGKSLLDWKKPDADIAKSRASVDHSRMERFRQTLYKGDVP